ncbi:uncharacterized protein LOC143018718 [Oratosquilla oratoria]|uniref:uncharacterized protein LOC143018718 n=1 Tax=Oratosquilla oratoria TaxID=337810 RepID=UPI003F7598E3
MTDDQPQEGSAFCAPHFSSRDPTIWFTILECNFKANRITTSLTKFSHACGLLPPDVLLQVSDTISKAPTSNTPYEDLKQAVLARLESSESTRLQELLSKEELGSEKPSDLLRRMKRLLGDKCAAFDQSILLHLFYQRLPPTIQGNLFSAKNKLSLEELATLADDFMASVPVARPTIAKLTKQSKTQALAELVSKLALQVSALQEQVNNLHRRPPSPRYHRNRSRSTSRGRPKHQASASTIIALDKMQRSVHSRAPSHQHR